MRISVAIMHHPSRAAMLSNLIYSLGPGTPVTVVADLESKGPWFTAERAWASVHSGARHHVVIQDDVELPEGFMQILEHLVAAVPDEPIGLWHTRKRPVAKEALDRGDDFFVLGDGKSGPGVIMPVPDVADFLRWQRWHIDPACPNDDLRVGMWGVCTGRRMWFPTRSVLRHLDVPSIYAKRGKVERATMGGHAFIGAMGAKHDWRRPDDPLIDMRYGGNYSRWLDPPSKVKLREYVTQHGRFVADTKLWE